MNLSELLIPSLPGSTAAAPGIAAQGMNPQETGLFSGFAELFAATVTLEGETSETSEPDVSDLPGGNELPDLAGKDLPLLAATVPLANIAHAVPPAAGVTPEAPSQSILVQTEAAPIPGGAHATEATVITDARPAPQARENASQAVGVQNSTPQFIQPTTAQVAERPDAQTVGRASSQPGSEVPVPQATLERGRQPQASMQEPETASLAPVRLSVPLHDALRAVPFASTSTEGEEAAVQTLSDTPTKPIAPQHEARMTPVAQLLRPIAARTQAPAEAPDTPAVTGPETIAQRPSIAAPATQPVQAANPAPLAAEPPRSVPVSITAETVQTAPTAPQRHDFGQVIERLVEAREMARPGRAEMQVVHREFGQVSMQFDITGGALKVALANAHAGFAPAVQAALSERPVTPANEAAMRTDLPPQQQSQAPAQTTATPQSPASHSQGDAQQHRHHETPRQAGVQPQPREQSEPRESEAARRHERGRDNALFA